MASETSRDERVVSVRSVRGNSAVWFRFQPGLYEVHVTKAGEEMYRLVRNIGKSRSSKQAAERDGERIAKELGCDYRSGVCHGVRVGMEGMPGNPNQRGHVIVAEREARNVETELSQVQDKVSGLETCLAMLTSIEEAPGDLGGDSERHLAVAVRELNEVFHELCTTETEWRLDLDLV